MTIQELLSISNKVKKDQIKAEFWRASTDGSFSEIFFEAINTKGKDVINESKWVPKLPKESDFAYTRRCKVLVENEYSEKIIQTYLGYLAKAKTEEENFTSLGQYEDGLLYNIDNKNNDLEKFASDCQNEMLTTGKVFVMTDKEENGRPYSYIVPIENILDYSIDSKTGQVDYFKFQILSETENKKIAILTPETFQSYEINPNFAGGFLLTEIQNELGKVPVSLGILGDGTSIIDNAAKFQLMEMNMESDMWSVLHMGTISIFKAPEGAKEALTNMESFNFLSVPSDFTGEIGWVVYPYQNLNSHYEYLDRKKKTLFEIKNIKIQTSYAESGQSKRYSFMDMEAVLVFITMETNTLVTDIANNWLLYLDKKGDVSYKRSNVFGMETIKEFLEQLLIIMGFGMTPLMKEKFLIKIAEQTLDLTAQEKEENLKQIEELMGVQNEIDTRGETE